MRCSASKMFIVTLFESLNGYFELVSVISIASASSIAFVGVAYLIVVF